jgi:hypothetical protein
MVLLLMWRGRPSCAFAGTYLTSIDVADWRIVPGRVVSSCVGPSSCAARGPSAPGRDGRNFRHRVGNCAGIRRRLEQEPATAVVFRRIAAPMIGGIFTSFLMELVVYPAIYETWKWHFGLKR